MTPNLSTLRTFVEAARNESFTRAAAAVHLTQGAVSRQIRSLEHELGTPLFLRRARTVALTPAGRAYLLEVERAFAILDEAAVSIARAQRIAISLLPSFAALWLLPRIPRFEQRSPDIRLELELSYALSEFGEGGADVAIRYGAGEWRGTVTRRIFHETLVPVASPALLKTVRRDGLFALPLLSASGPARDTDGDIDWRAWSQGAKERIPDHARYRRLRDYQRVIHSASAGQGVAIARLGLVRPLVEKGVLVPVSATPVKGKTGHYFVTTATRWKAPEVQTLFRWLKSQAAARGR